MQRHEISDSQWSALRARWPQRRGPPAKRGDRAFVNAVVWIAKTGAPWRDVPRRYGNWKTVYNRFRNWAAREGWLHVFIDCAALSDNEVGGILDASIVRAHQDAAGGRGGVAQNALGRSRGGFSTKIHAVVDLDGKPLGLRVTPGQQHEATIAEDLLDYVPGTACLADGGYDADRILAAAIQRGLQPVIPPSEGRKRKRRYNKKLYRLRYRVEVFFHGLKRFRRIATRYEIGDHLRAVDWDDRLDRFELDHESAGYKEVYAGFARLVPLVEHAHTRLLLSRDLAQRELYSQSLLVDRFQKSRPELAVNLDGGADHSARKLVELGR